MSRQILRPCHAVYGCHLEQPRGSEASEGQSKHPEDVGSAMPIRGVLPGTVVLPFPACATDSITSSTAIFSTLQFWQLPDFGNSGNLSRTPAGRIWPTTGTVKCGFRDNPSRKLPESAWWCKHPRDLSTRPRSLRSLVFAQDDSLP